MARPSATAALLLLVLSLLAIAHCRPHEAESATNAEPAATVPAGDDENGQPNAALPREELLLPVDEPQQQGFLRLPSHRLRRHGPCHHGLSGHHHHHLWWARHRGAFGDDAPRRFHHPHFEVPSLPAAASDVHEISDAGESRPVFVAEPDPDRSLPGGDGEGEVARMEPSFGDADGAAHEEAAHEDEGAAVRAWKKEMQRRWWSHHHAMRLHRHLHGEEEGHEQDEETAEGLKRFHHHHEDEEKDMVRKRFRHAAEHDEDSDSDDEVEEMVRLFRKAIMRRRFGHGHRFHHRHRHGNGHRHAEEAEKADAQEDGGVVSWIRGLMNRF